MTAPDLFILESTKVKAGDMLVFTTSDHMSLTDTERVSELISLELDPLGVKFLIVTGVNTFHITKEEILNEHCNNKNGTP